MLFYLFFLFGSVFRGNKELQIRRTVVDDSGVYQCFAENDVGNIQVSSRIRVRRSGEFTDFYSVPLQLLAQLMQKI